MKVENVDVSVLVEEALDVPGAQVPLVHHLCGPPGVLGRGEYRLRLPTGASSPREKSVRSERSTLIGPHPRDTVLSLAEPYYAGNRSMP